MTYRIMSWSFGLLVSLSYAACASEPATQSAQSSAQEGLEEDAVKFAPPNLLTIKTREECAASCKDGSFYGLRQLTCFPWVKQKFPEFCAQLEFLEFEAASEWPWPDKPYDGEPICSVVGDKAHPGASVFSLMGVGRCYGGMGGRDCYWSTDRPCPAIAEEEGVIQRQDIYTGNVDTCRSQCSGDLRQMAPDCATIPGSEERAIGDSYACVVDGHLSYFRPQWFGTTELYTPTSRAPWAQSERCIVPWPVPDRRELVVACPTNFGALWQRAMGCDLKHSWVVRPLVLEQTPRDRVLKRDPDMHSKPTALQDFERVLGVAQFSETDSEAPETTLMLHPGTAVCFTGSEEGDYAKVKVWLDPTRALPGEDDLKRLPPQELVGWVPRASFLKAEFLGTDLRNAYAMESLSLFKFSGPFRGETP